MAAASYMYPVGAIVAIKKLQRVRKDTRAREGLEEILPLLRCIASIHNDLAVGTEQLQPLELVAVAEDQYELR